jgi:hypothetical protein
MRESVAAFKGCTASEFLNITEKGNSSYDDSNEKVY